MLIVKKVFAAAKLQLSQVGAARNSPHLTHMQMVYYQVVFLYVLDQQQQHMCKSLFVCLKHILLRPMDDDFVPPSDMFVN